jgi:CheY-like chemotaxis protein
MKQIKQKYSGKNIPIAALTGYAMEHDKELFLKNGFDYFIIKPFGRSDLMNVINEVLSKK